MFCEDLDPDPTEPFLLAQLAGSPSSVGIVDQSELAGLSMKGVKVVKIDGKRPGESGYLE